MACADDKEHATLWEISLLSLSYGNEPLRPSVLASIQNGPSHTSLLYTVEYMYSTAFWLAVHIQKNVKAIPKEERPQCLKMPKKCLILCINSNQINNLKKAPSNQFFENLVIVIFLVLSFKHRRSRKRRRNP